MLKINKDSGKFKINKINITKDTFKYDFLIKGEHAILPAYSNSYRVTVYFEKGGKNYYRKGYTIINEFDVDYNLLRAIKDSIAEEIEYYSNSYEEMKNYLDKMTEEMMKTCIECYKNRF